MYNNNSFFAVAFRMSYSFLVLHLQTRHSHWYDLWRTPLWMDIPKLRLILVLGRYGNAEKIEKRPDQITFQLAHICSMSHSPSDVETSLWHSKSSLLATRSIGAGWLPFTRLITFFIFDISCVRETTQILSLIIHLEWMQRIYTSSSSFNGKRNTYLKCLVIC